jgi:hypothetical protein
MVPHCHWLPFAFKNIDKIIHLVHKGLFDDYAKGLA